ncbi:MAG TPA: hypothetical protein VMU50_09350 [Polyangia bacterium]|nr:hypothetical protein [Polyangia bacterium]
MTVTKTLFTAAPPQPQPPGAAEPPPRATLTPVDRAAARATLEDVAYEHVRAVRNLMIELQWGGAAAAWVVAARGALSSLRRMAQQIELGDLDEGISVFLEALDQAVVQQAIPPELARALTDRYAPLAKAFPRAFALESDRDRREPLLVQSLLGQVPGMDPLSVQRLFAVGLGRLDSLFRATAEEVAIVADLPIPLAAALVEKAQELRQTAAPPEIADPGRVLGPLLAVLKRQQQEYSRAAQGWSADNLAAKRRHRRERERTFQKIKGAVARLGEVEFALRLQTYSFARRIDELQQFIEQAGGQERSRSHGRAHA